MRWAVAAGLVLLAGCQKSFDDRYADAQEKLNEQAASIDKDLAEKESEAAMAEALNPPRNGEGDHPQGGGGSPPSGATSRR